MAGQERPLPLIEQELTQAVEGAEKLGLEVRALLIAMANQKLPTFPRYRVCGEKNRFDDYFNSTSESEGMVIEGGAYGKAWVQPLCIIDVRPPTEDYTKPVVVFTRGGLFALQVVACRMAKQTFAMYPVPAMGSSTEVRPIDYLVYAPKVIGLINSEAEMLATANT